MSYESTVHRWFLQSVLLVLAVICASNGAVFKRDAVNNITVKTLADCKIALNGDYPHPTNCTKFINCYNGLGGEVSCQRYLHFNRASRRCEFHPQNAGCALAKTTGNVTRPLPGEPVNCPKLFNGDYSHPTDCSKFITCSNGYPSVRECPANLVFDYKSDRCEFQGKATCGSVPTTAAPQQATTTAGPVDCEKERTGYHQHESNCSLYVVCVNGFKFVTECPKGLHWSQAATTCVFPNFANCKILTQQTSGSPFDCTNKPDGDYPHEQQCSLYITCSNGYRYERPCPMGLHWSASLKLCETPGKANCTLSSQLPVQSAGPVNCTKVPTGYYQHESNCSLYVMCLHQFKYVRECPKGLHWSQAAKNCDFPNFANCKVPTQQTAGSPVDCTKKPNGDYPHEQQCSLFITCSNGYRYERSCPMGLHWSQNLSRCETTGKANCTLTSQVPLQSAGKPAAS